jgi:glycosyltransferase involved in cell wall biosynthesis
MPVGGAETLLVNLMRRMNPAVMTPEVICLKEPGPLGETLKSEFKVHSRLISGKYDIGVLWRLRQLMNDRRADAVITVGAGDKMFWGRLAAHLAGVPVIASALHSTGWPDGVGRMNRALTRITDAFIGVADSHGKFLVDVEAFPTEKVVVIRNGVDCDRFRPDPAARFSVRQELGLSEKTPLVGIVAALREEKNHLLFVQMAAGLVKQHSDSHFVIVGDGPQRPMIEQLARELNVVNRIHLLGTRSDTPRLVSALDCFTLCSLNEASPVSILEALACGVPVVSTNVGSISESILEGITGHLVPSEDCRALVKSVAGILSNPVRGQAMGRAGREHVVRTGSLESMVTGYEKLVTSIYDRCVERFTAQYSLPRKLRIESLSSTHLKTS